MNPEEYLAKIDLYYQLEQRASDVAAQLQTAVDYKNTDDIEHLAMERKAIEAMLFDIDQELTKGLEGWANAYDLNPILKDESIIPSPSNQQDLSSEN